MMHLFPGRQSIAIGVFVVQWRIFPLVVVITAVNDHHVTTSYDITNRDLIT
jgi:hypothetical protein